MPLEQGHLAEKASSIEKRLDKYFDCAMIDGMNYCETEHEHIDYQAEQTQSAWLDPCGVNEASFILVDDASPSEPPLYFRVLRGAYTWAQNTNDYAHGEWSVFKLDGQVL